VKSEDYTEEGTLLKGRLPARFLGRFEEYRVQKAAVGRRRR